MAAPKSDGPGTGMELEKRRLKREFLTMTKMVGMYCVRFHDGTRDKICAECEEFLGYAQQRLAKCPYEEKKPTCTNCPIHCYKKAQKERASEIMRYAGPRMLTRHPYLAITHILDGFRKAPSPMELRQMKKQGQPKEKTPE